MQIEWMYSLLGGIIIGVAVTLLLWLNGRVTGIAGIIYGLFNWKTEKILWRVYFIGGLVLAGLVGKIFLKTEAILHEESYLKLVFAGLLVGFGTVLGSGCTSGHGVCGLSRLSPRSLASTLVFMGVAVLTVFIIRTVL